MLVLLLTALPLSSLACTPLNLKPGDKLKIKLNADNFVVPLKFAYVNSNHASRDYGLPTTKDQALTNVKNAFTDAFTKGFMELARTKYPAIQQSEVQSALTLNPPSYDPLYCNYTRTQDNSQDLPSGSAPGGALNACIVKPTEKTITDFCQSGCADSSATFSAIGNQYRSLSFEGILEYNFIVKYALVFMAADFPNELQNKILSELKALDDYRYAFSSGTLTTQIST